VERLAGKFSPGLPVGVDALAEVDQIEQIALDSGRREEYWKFLDDAFCAQSRTLGDLRFHRSLISLGFAGLATTNYDPTLEQACDLEYRELNLTRCEEIDLREPDPRYRVFRFLRSLAVEPHHRYVLHLHGFHRWPARLILGGKSYEAAYGHRHAEPDDTLRTFHRKVLYAVLATRPVVFVGFGMADPFFVEVLRLLKRDFVLTDEPAHFAIMPYEVDAVSTATEHERRVAHDREQAVIREKLPNGVQPVFYHAPDGNHDELPGLIADLASELGRPTPPAQSFMDRFAARGFEEV